jgi:hypothetical protein
MSRSFFWLSRMAVLIAFGPRLIFNPNLSYRFIGHPTWTLSLPLNEEIQSTTPSKRGPVASVGKVLGNRPNLSYRFIGHPTWTLSLPLNEEIQSTTPSKRGPVASVGKVLGNCSTLYKYLNPHLTALTTSSFTSHPPTCAIYLVDAAKGSVYI